ncbi:MAG: ABC transporter ATP-binding protein [Nitrosopumilus sp.]|nr:ABC transporter ATP-binding protein [Nitrosopumilus sp.]
MSLLQLKHVKKYYSVKQNALKFFSPVIKIKKVIDDVSFDLDQGKVLVLAGESGSGKTTLAKLIIGSITPDSGDIFFLGQDINIYKKNKTFYSLIHMIHQDPYSSINPYLKIKDIVMEPLKIHHSKLSFAEKEKKVKTALSRTKLEPVEEFLEKYPDMLSGGQRQRVSIARAIVSSPRLIIADEPVSMLDVSIRAEILSLLNDLRNSLNISIIYITHDLATSRFIGDKIGIMFAGNIVEFGDIDEVLLNPLHPYTWMLLDAVNFSSLGSDIYYKNYDKTNLLNISDTGCKFYNRCKLSFKECTNNPQEYEISKKHYVSCFNYKNQQV